MFHTKNYWEFFASWLGAERYLANAPLLNFKSEEHEYFYKEQKVGVSASKISAFTATFWKTADINPSVLKKAADNGTRLHKLAEMIVLSPEETNTTLFNNWCRNTNFSATLIERGRRLIPIIKGFVKRYQLIPLGVELKLVVPDYLPAIVAGTLDLVAWSKKKKELVIIDWKSTRSVIKKAEEIKNSAQLDIQYRMLQHNFTVRKAIPVRMLLGFINDNPQIIELFTATWYPENHKYKLYRFK